jgi:hypothetical protein
MSTKMRYCFNCGAELGAFATRDYEPTDTCGRPACEREARQAMEDERQQAHEQLDRDMGY